MNEEHEHLYKESSKASKQERKYLQAKDRSKFKKSDHAKWEAQRKQEIDRSEGLSDQPIGRVLSVSPQGFAVDFEGNIYSCTLRGLLKKERGHDKNLVTTGDFVRFTRINASEGQILSVEPRKSLLARADNLSRRKLQLIAANIDQVLITLSVVNPPLKPFLADRYIIAAEKGGMAPVILVNKVDLLKGPLPEDLQGEPHLLEEFKKSFMNHNIPVIEVSTVTGEGLDQLRAIMKDKASVFSGQSGAGKSSLINAITGLDLKIGGVVEKTRKGSHTTTKAQLIPLSFGGFCIDTPGIKSFGVWNLSQDEIESYFEEIHELGAHCKYPDCRHIEETPCAVKDALFAGKLSPLRYHSYLNLLDTMNEDHIRR